MKKLKGFALTWLKDTALVLAEIVIGLLMCALFLIVAVLGFLWTLGKHLWQRDYSAKRQFKPIMRAFALCNDCFANASGGEMLNDIMKVKDGEIKYGWFQQTISSVTGLRFIFNHRDSRLRKVLNKVHKDHCELAPSEMEMFYYGSKSMKNNGKQTT